MACRRGARCVPRRRRRSDRASRVPPGSSPTPQPRAARPTPPSSTRSIFSGAERRAGGVGGQCRAAVPLGTPGVAAARRSCGPGTARSYEQPRLRCCAWSTKPSHASPRGTTTRGNKMVRWEETLRRDFVEDLLRGDADVRRLVDGKSSSASTWPIPTRLRWPPSGRLNETEAMSFLERAVPCAGPVTATSSSPPRTAGSSCSPADTDVPRAARGTPGQPHAGRGRTPARPWRSGPSAAPTPGPYGIARSYEEAREVTMAPLDSSLIQAEQLLIYRVLLRDQPAIADLVQRWASWCTPAVAGAPLSETLDAYFATGGVATTAAPAIAPVRARRHLPTQPDQDPHGIRRRRPRPALHRPRPPFSARSCGWPHPQPGRRPVVRSAGPRYPRYPDSPHPKQAYWMPNARS